MDEEVIPSLKAILEAQADVSDVALSFQDDRVSFSHPQFSFTDHKPIAFVSLNLN